MVAPLVAKLFSAAMPALERLLDKVTPTRRPRRCSNCGEKRTPHYWKT